MSFVSIIARENFVSITSDGRVCGHAGLPIQEDYKKFIEVNKNYFIAYAGQKEPCELFISNSGLISPLVPNFELLARQTQFKLLTNPFDKCRILLAFGGLDNLGQISIVTFSTLQPEIQVFKPKDDAVNYVFLNNSSLDDTQIVEKLIEHLKTSGIETADQIKIAQTELNNYVASKDRTVNKNIFNHVISKRANGHVDNIGN